MLQHNHPGGVCSCGQQQHPLTGFLDLHGGMYDFLHTSLYIDKHPPPPSLSTNAGGTVGLKLLQLDEVCW